MAGPLPPLRGKGRGWGLDLTRERPPLRQPPAVVLVRRDAEVRRRANGGAGAAGVVDAVDASARGVALIHHPIAGRAGVREHRPASAVVARRRLALGGDAAVAGVDALHAFPA